MKDELDPGEETTYKIPEFVRDTGPFPNTPFVVTARGKDITGMVNYSFEEMIAKIEHLGRAIR